MKRLIDCNYSDIQRMDAGSLLQAIRYSEGRVIASEIIASAQPLVDKVSNVELAAAFGADILVLNLYDVNNPRINGMLPKDGRQGSNLSFGQVFNGNGRTLHDVREWTGRLAAINLEPLEHLHAEIADGRLASAQNAEKAAKQGANMILVTGNPGSGVTMTGIGLAVKRMKAATGNSVVYFAGRIHAAGTCEPVVTENDIQLLADAGADGVILPAPGTVPGITLDISYSLVNAVHKAGLLAWNGIGTSQEGAQEQVIEQIALMSKMSGADVHHIGDSGMFGIAPPENIYAYSLAIRGRRHTWHRMASSHQR
jgi:hypothetical protein